MLARWVAGLIETAIILTAVAVIRVQIIPGFTDVPGRFQMLLELTVTAVDRVLLGIVQVTSGALNAVRIIAEGIVKLAAAIERGGSTLWRTRRTFLTLWGIILVALLVLSALVQGHEEHGDVSATMRDAVLHDMNRINLFGLKDVNPGLIAAMTISGVLLFCVFLIRLIVIPRFKDVPGKFQLALETLVRTLDGLAKVDSPTRRTFIGAYVFAAGVYIFTGTLFELFGVQAITTKGLSVALPAPLSDVNAAICMGCLSYLIIVFGGGIHRGPAGIKAALKEFSLPISMSFRLFGALLSGLLVTELVYHYTALRYGIPVLVGIIFTLLHAIVQSYVLTMLVGMYYHEVTE